MAGFLTAGAVYTLVSTPGLITLATTTGGAVTGAAVGGTTMAVVALTPASLAALGTSATAVTVSAASVTSASLATVSAAAVTSTAVGAAAGAGAAGGAAAGAAVGGAAGVAVEGAVGAAVGAAGACAAAAAAVGVVVVTAITVVLVNGAVSHRREIQVRVLNKSRLPLILGNTHGEGGTRIAAPQTIAPGEFGVCSIRNNGAISGAFVYTDPTGRHAWLIGGGNPMVGGNRFGCRYLQGRPRSYSAHWLHDVAVDDWEMYRREETFEAEIGWKTGECTTGAVTIDDPSYGPGPRWLCWEKDRSKQHEIMVLDGYGGNWPVYKDGIVRSFPINLDDDGWLYWYSGGSKERTRPENRRADYVKVWRNTDDHRAIKWDFYARYHAHE